MKFKRLLAPVLVALLLALPATSAAASEVATVVFDGTATTGGGGPLPIDIDASHIMLRADGAVGIAYTYKAAGQARGDLKGRFQYEEHGYLFFRNPTDPTTFAGSRYDSGVFTLRPNEGAGASVTIADSDPSGYQAGQRSAPLPQLDPLLMSYGDHVVNRLGLVPQAGSVRYGVFTFTTAYGTFWGISTPDSRHFLLRLKLAPGRGEHRQQVPSSSNGDDFNQNTRFSHGERGD